MNMLHAIFEVCKFIFGLGALFGLLAIGIVMLWFLGHVVVRLALRHQAAERCAGLRRLFLES